ncbi:MAG: hypothetical protein K0U52_07135 [Gammaproteobacteria bacterium]|nr:hypothetical protein [Gammaproteobacteria bacterium]
MSCLQTLEYTEDMDDLIAQCDLIIHSADVIQKNMDFVDWLLDTQQVDQVQSMVTQIDSATTQLRLHFLDMIKNLHQIMCIQNASTGQFEKTMWSFVDKMRPGRSTPTSTQNEIPSAT